MLALIGTTSRPAGLLMRYPWAPGLKSNSAQNSNNTGIQVPTKVHLKNTCTKAQPIWIKGHLPCLSSAIQLCRWQPGCKQWQETGPATTVELCPEPQAASDSSWQLISHRHMHKFYTLFLFLSVCLCVCLSLSYSVDDPRWFAHNVTLNSFTKWESRQLYNILTTHVLNPYTWRESERGVVKRKKPVRKVINFFFNGSDILYYHMHYAEIYKQKLPCKFDVASTYNVAPLDHGQYPDITWYCLYLTIYWYRHLSSVWEMG